jgi:hypothetical protein
MRALNWVYTPPMKLRSWFRRRQLEREFDAQHTRPDFCACR